MNHPTFDVATVTLNPAIDLTVTIEDFATGEVNRIKAQRSNAGGKGVNVAAALADYGHSVAATGFLGRENSGIFEALFEKKRIADHFVRTAGQTRFGLKINDPVRQQTTDINFPGSAVGADEMASLLQRIGALNAGWFVLAGSVPPGIPPFFYRDVTSLLKASDCHVIVDASGEALRHAIETSPDIVKPNLVELETLLDRKLQGKGEVLRAAQSLLKYGIKLVVVSMGAEGALFVSRNEALLAVPPKVVVVSTVGAGDAMVAGIISAQLSNQPLAQCARLATAFSLNVITHPDTGLSSAESLQALISHVQILPAT